MSWVAVDSSAISRVAYVDGEIYVEWEAGIIYAYQAPESVYQELLSADSVGKYANRVLKKYPARRINV